MRRHRHPACCVPLAQQCGCLHCVCARPACLLGGGGDAGTGACNAGAGDANTGGGGAGASNGVATGNGGSGLVILRFPTAYSITIGAGLTGSTTTSGLYKYTTLTAGTGNVSWA